MGDPLQRGVAIVATGLLLELGLGRHERLGCQQTGADHVHAGLEEDVEPIHALALLARQRDRYLDPLTMAQGEASRSLLATT